MGLIKQNKKSVTKKKTVRKPAKQSKKPISNAVYETKIDEILKKSKLLSKDKEKSN